MSYPRANVKYMFDTLEPGSGVEVPDDVEDGPAISVSTARKLACTATLSWMLHDRDGTLLDVGRRRRRPTAALRRAARERDKCRVANPFGWTARQHHDDRPPELRQPAPGDEAGAPGRLGGPASARVGSTG
jgi:Domain of unknown function (DUF222)